ncbi:hypothetical protein LX69_01749 [Breznakibacter xylanolyticus]|uniref:Uncharacterized protein n=1 Tax=Breznakibacter xylanolyticus TaxID=990 RepID=A0A2W7Q4Q6_9BACT|nr:hypothetical protein LX69_01749 [Breznakibacter xylanolyticus]
MTLMMCHFTQLIHDGNITVIYDSMSFSYDAELFSEAFWSVKVFANHCLYDKLKLQTQVKE